MQEANRRLEPGQHRVNTTSNARETAHLFSPFLLGPVPLYGGYEAANMENAWQYAKVYASLLEPDGTAGDKYFAWARAGWAEPRANRYPMGRGKRPLYSLWEGEKLSYVEARKRVYFPLYRDAVLRSGGYARLTEMASQCEELVLVDFDGYRHRDLGMSLADVFNSEKHRMGHAFVLVAMLEYGPDVTPEKVEAACGNKPPPQQTSLF
jgi:hypothetical protein